MVGISYQTPAECLVCHQLKEVKFVRGWTSDKKSFSLFECHNCKIQFWTPFIPCSNSKFEDESNNNFTAPKIYKEYHKEFLKNCPVKKNDIVLDIGCGRGEFVSELEKIGCHVFGVDFDSVAIEIAKKRFGLKNVFSMSIDDFMKIKDLPKFDVITCFESIMYFKNPVEFICGMRNILKPKGRVFISAPSRERMLASRNAWDFPHLPYSYQITRWNKESFLNIFKLCGFRAKSIKYVGQFQVLLLTVTEQLRAKAAIDKISSSVLKKSGIIIQPKIFMFLSLVKRYVFAWPIALILWVCGKILNKKNGTIFAEFIY